MKQIDFSDKSNEEIIQSICKTSTSSDIQVEARQEWERRKIIREDKMLAMTEDLVTSTNKMLMISKLALWVAIIACCMSFFAIIFPSLQGYLTHH
jgi:hypothetical protein